MPQQKMYTVKEVAEMKRIKDETVSKWCREDVYWKQNGHPEKVHFPHAIKDPDWRIPECCVNGTCKNGAQQEEQKPEDKPDPEIANTRKQIEKAKVDKELKMLLADISSIEELATLKKELITKKAELDTRLQSVAEKEASLAEREKDLESREDEANLAEEDAQLAKKDAEQAERKLEGLKQKLEADRAAIESSRKVLEERAAELEGLNVPEVDSKIGPFLFEVHKIAVKIARKENKRDLEDFGYPQFNAITPKQWEEAMIQFARSVKATISIQRGTMKQIIKIALTGR